MSIWRWIFSGGRRRRNRQTEAGQGPGPDERLDRVLRQLRERLQKFLVVRSAPPGPIPTGGSYTLTKTSGELFRLESEADGLAILINTRPFLTRHPVAGQPGQFQIRGLLRMSEVELCRALSDKTPGEFLSHAEAPGEGSLTLFQELLGAPAADRQARARAVLLDERSEPVPRSGAVGVLPQPAELLQWPLFDADQMIARNSPNVLAHVLIHAAPELEAFLRGRCSTRLKLVLIEELERLGSAGSRPEMNPGSRNLGLLQFEDALTEFRRTMSDYQTRLERERLRGQRRLSRLKQKERLP
jgi:hypothetical protein